MKNLLLLCVLFLVISCSNDDEPVNKCGKITVKGWDYMQGYFFKLDNKKEMILVSAETYNKNQLNQAYCK
jgi:hypothetical protein